MPVNTVQLKGFLPRLIYEGKMHHLYFKVEKVHMFLSYLQSDRADLEQSWIWGTELRVSRTLLLSPTVIQLSRNAGCLGTQNFHFHWTHRELACSTVLCCSYRAINISAYISYKTKSIPPNSTLNVPTNNKPIRKATEVIISTQRHR